MVVVLLTTLVGVALVPDVARAACGCMIARNLGPVATSTGAKITNTATKVVLLRTGDKTTVVMSNDFDGDVQEFGLVIPVPAVVQKRDVKLVDPAIFARLEKATAPRIVRLEEQDPCIGSLWTTGRGAGVAAMAKDKASDSDEDANAKSLGVVAQAKFAVGEYDVTVLSAEQSTGLLTWLDQNGYRVPKEAADVLESYIKQKSFFLVAKVDARRLSRSGRSFLKPLLVQFDTPKFMLPIRLGMVNNDGLQELLVFTFADGRVEPTNYRAAKLDTGHAVPAFVADDADAAFEAIFATATKQNDTRAVFTEWAGMLSTAGLLPMARKLTAHQTYPDTLDRRAVARCPVPPNAKPGDSFQIVKDGQTMQVRPSGADGGGGDGGDSEATVACLAKVVGEAPRARLGARVIEEAPSMFATRLHFRYDEARFPEDLVLQVTKDKTPIRSKWYARVPWKGEALCTAATKYLAISDEQLEKEIATYAALSGLSVDDVRAKVKARERR